MLTVKPAAAKPIVAQPCRRVHTPRCKTMQPSDTCLQSNQLLLSLSPHSLAAVYTHRAANPCSLATHANSPALLLSLSPHSLAAVHTHRVAKPCSPASHACSQTRCYAYRRTVLPPRTHAALQTHTARRHMLAVKPTAAKPIVAQPCRRVHSRATNQRVPAAHANNQACCYAHHCTALPPRTQPHYKPAQPGGPYRLPGQSGAINTGCRRCGSTSSRCGAGRPCPPLWARRLCPRAP